MDPKFQLEMFIRNNVPWEKRDELIQLINKLIEHYFMVVKEKGKRL